MAYKLIITERADEQIDRLAAYLIRNLKNPDAAFHFLDELSESKDEYLFLRGYREALFKEMNYRVVFRTDKRFVYVLGVFHTLEDYGKKVE